MDAHPSGNARSTHTGQGTAVSGDFSPSTEYPVSRLADIERLSTELTAEYLENYGLLPLECSDGRLLTATWKTPPDPQAVDDLYAVLGARVVLVVLPEEAVRAAIHRLYGEGAVTARSLIADLGGDVRVGADGELALDDLVNLANEAPVVRLVNLLLLEGLESRASDVHVEAYAQGLRVRYRVDGVLQDVPSPPPNMAAAVISRLKIMAELDIAERRVPQDGRIRLRLQDRQVDVRVSIIPTLRGESVVLRLLDKERTGIVGLEKLGMGEDTLQQFLRAISRPHGIVLATGPTGSGKTTTLYSGIDHIRTGREKILTVEDPVEYELAGVPQMPVNEKAGVTFATALRALLRQDPDVLLVGEIRDEETAEIATHASLTGHLVLSTLHTNDAAGALVRLVDLGVAPYLVASTVEAVLAQRLVRQVCPQCAAEEMLDGNALREFGFETACEGVPFLRGRGCASCRGTGYQGRIGIYEILAMDEEVRTEVLHRRDSGALRRLAVERGMRTLRLDGLRQITAGVTTPEEVLRVTRM